MEFDKALEKKRIIIFTAAAFIIAWALFFSIPLSGSAYGKGSSIILLAAAMFAPSAANILTRLLTKEGFGNMYLRPNFKRHKTLYLLIFFGPTLLILLSSVIYFLVFPGQFDSELRTLNMLAVMSGKTGLSAQNIVLLSVLQLLIIGPVVNIIPTLGEELGWRGYLLIKLRIFFSDRASLVISGIIWGLWHAPVIAMGHNYGADYPAYPYLGILMMVLFCVGLGIIEGYVTIKLQSAIPAAMIHSAVNAGAGLPSLLIKGSYSTILGPAITGLIGGLPFLILAAILLYKTKGKSLAFKETV